MLSYGAKFSPDAARKIRMDLTVKTRREIAMLVAKSYGKGGHISKKTIQWEKSWINHQTIPERKAEKTSIIYPGWMMKKSFSASRGL